MLLALAIACFLGGASGQSGQDEAWYQSFINGAGKAIFFVAWPTDTYDHMEFEGIDWRPSGADVKVVLYGNSWLEGNLWTEVVAEVRNGDIKNLRFGRYHAVIRPGSTFEGFGELVKAFNDEYNRQHPSLSILCLSNTTQVPIVYSLPSEQISPQTLEPNQTWMFWHNGSAEFEVSFSAASSALSQKSIRAKGLMQSSKPSSCSAGMIYDFVAANQQIGLNPRTWIPGTEDPFTPSLIRSETAGKWNCAPGYKWAIPDDPTDTTCVTYDTGLLGVTLKVEDGSVFPRIVAVRPGGPAGRAGVPPGSYLVRVNGESMQNLSINQVVARMRGQVNTVVHIGVTTPGREQIQWFDLKRE